MHTDLSNSVVLITGAGGGIGRAAASALAQRGAGLYLTGRNTAKLNETASLCRSAAFVRIIIADIQKEDAPEKIMSMVSGKLTCLINNAGFARLKPLVQTSMTDLLAHFTVNAAAPFLLARAAYNLLKQSGCGTIINIASVTAHQGYADQGAYTASKHAMLGISKVMAREWQKDNIRVHVISPGGVYTPMVAEMRSDLAADELMQPEDIAEIILFLLSHRTNAVIDEIQVRRAGKTPW